MGSFCHWWQSLEVVGWGSRNDFVWYCNGRRRYRISKALIIYISTAPNTIKTYVYVLHNRKFNWPCISNLLRKFIYGGSECQCYLFPWIICTSDVDRGRNSPSAGVHKWTRSIFTQHSADSKKNTCNAWNAKDITEDGAIFEQSK